MNPTRSKIIQEVLSRMDEIIPAEDINIVEGQLIDSLLDNSLSEYLLLCDIHRTPILNTYYTDIDNSTVTVPANFVRYVSGKCNTWKRELYESELVYSSSFAGRMSAFRFHEPTNLKPFIMLCPAMNTLATLKVLPFVEGDTFVLQYIPFLTPEELYNKLNINLMDDGTPVGDTFTHGFWEAYIWYVAYSVLQTMGESSLAQAALTHAQIYHVLPSNLSSQSKKV